MDGHELLHHLVPSRACWPSPSSLSLSSLPTPSCLVGACIGICGPSNVHGQPYPLFGEISSTAKVTYCWWRFLYCGEITMEYIPCQPIVPSSYSLTPQSMPGIVPFKTPHPLLTRNPTHHAHSLEARNRQSQEYPSRRESSDDNEELPRSPKRTQKAIQEGRFKQRSAVPVASGRRRLA